MKPSRSILLLLVLAGSHAEAEVEPALSAEWGSPQRLSANLGVRIGKGTASEPGTGRGLLLQVQPGLGGGALNVGWTPFSLSAWGAQAVGVAVKARLLRSWGTPSAIEPHQTFGGAEVEVAWIVKFSFGVLRRLESGSGKATVFTWSVGMGL